MKRIVKILKKAWETMLLGYERQSYIDLYCQGLISREEMLEKTE